MTCADAAAMMIRRQLAPRLAGDAASVVVLRAPAGYGKSALAAQVVQAFSRVSWIAGQAPFASSASVELVVVDDAHEIEPGRLADLAARAVAAGARVVVCAREGSAGESSAPLLPGALELRRDDLRFSRSEIAAALGVAIDDATVAEVEAASAGCAAAVAAWGRQPAAARSTIAAVETAPSLARAAS